MSDGINLVEHIEAVLFYEAEPMNVRDLARFFSCEDAAIRLALNELAERLSSGALRLVQLEDTVELVTAPHVSETIEKLRRDDLKRDIGKAGAETLAIILYRGPQSRAEIDNIRGVNSSFILRNLLIRGLIERRTNPRDQRSFIYAATPALLNHLGVARREELPQFADIMNALDTFEKQRTEAAPQSLTTE